MNDDETTEIVGRVMREFAQKTGLDPVSAHPNRYLWTDAFAVCNFLELHRRTGDRGYLALASHLIDQVHLVLGRHRTDDTRRGWISGLDEKEGKQHPTAGGLRIGKELNERRKNEPVNYDLEWEQDGQYFHYLTKWMHALNRIGRVTSDPRYSTWAIELAHKANAAFSYLPQAGGKRRMYWKMSIDLTRPLVMSMGQHDPLDGFVTFCELQATMLNANGTETPVLATEIKDMGEILVMGSLATNDPLGMGGLLMDATRVAQIESVGRPVREGLLESLIDAALISVKSFSLTGELELPAESRLAFRELGLSIGLKGVPKIIDSLNNSQERRPSRTMLERLGDLKGFSSIGNSIDEFWMDVRSQNASTWIDHREINMVMLATSLAPESFLSI